MKLQISFMDVMGIAYELIVPNLIFMILIVVGRGIYKIVATSRSRVFNPVEYFPEEELETLKQVYYLIMMFIFFIFIIYIMLQSENDIQPMIGLQIIISTYIALTLDYSSWKNKLLFFLLVPYEGIILILHDQALVVWPIYLIHILVYVYFIKQYFDKFRQYTETNGLGITIILLFSIIFFSFISTILAEGVTPLNAMVMVSNAFTSNGYAVLGSTGIGKLNSLLLVWGGYIISGVGTATLTAAIILKHHHKQDEELNKRLDELESLIKNNKE